MVNRRLMKLLFEQQPFIPLDTHIKKKHTAPITPAYDWLNVERFESRKETTATINMKSWRRIARGRSAR